MDDLYRDEILEHWRRPHHQGALQSPNAVGEGDNPLCGDHLRFELETKDGLVSAVSFTGRGCAISTAAASMLADEIGGKSLDAIGSLSEQDAIDLLGVEISPARRKCALLARDTVRLALAGALPR